MWLSEDAVYIQQWSKGGCYKAGTGNRPVPAEDFTKKQKSRIAIAERILSICEKPTNFEGILQEVFRGYGLAMNFEQYVLVGSTVRSYLSWLKDTGKLDAVFEDNMLLWQRIG